MTRAAKAKGRGGQQEVRDKLLETFPEFEPDDIKSTWNRQVNMLRVSQ